MPQNNVTLGEAAELLRNGDNYLILCHKRPDCDTVGSALALRTVLSSLGKTVHVACADHGPSNAEFLFGGSGENSAMKLPENFGDMIPVTVDVASRSQLGTLDAIFGEKILLKLDHHEIGDDFAKFNYTEPDSAACGEIIYALALCLRADISLCAKCLFAAVSSDTGCFRYANTTPRTHRIAAALIEAGADQYFINHSLFESRSQSEIRAITAAYNSMKFYCNGRIAAVTVTEEDKKRLGISDSDLGVINPLTREIRGVTVGITVKQETAVQPNGKKHYKLSMRSDPSFPVNVLCAQFGGGGHTCAAGCEIDGDSPDEVLRTVLGRISCDGENILPKGL